MIPLETQTFRNHNKFIIWGAGSVGRIAMEFLNSHNKKIAYFLDSNPTKNKAATLGYKLYSPSSDNISKYPIVIATSMVNGVLLDLKIYQKKSLKPKIIFVFWHQGEYKDEPIVSLESLECIRRLEKTSSSTIFNPYKRKVDKFYLFLRRVTNLITHPFGKYPNVFLVNLYNSGSSALDPVLKEILAKRWYFLTPFGPEGSDFVNSITHDPLYHWSHSSPEVFQNYLGHRNSKFIYLHRDPRDAVISRAYDMMNQNLYPGKSLEDVLPLIYKGDLRANVDNAIKWMKCGCLVITFDDMKRDMFHVMSRIIDYLGIDDITDKEIKIAMDKFSFEKVSGRKLGEEGPIIRSGYMHRKGISGEWKSVFSPIMREEFKSIYGQHLISLGYEKDLNW